VVLLKKHILLLVFIGAVVTIGTGTPLQHDLTHEEDQDNCRNKKHQRERSPLIEDVTRYASEDEGEHKAPYSQPKSQGGTDDPPQGWLNYIYVGATVVIALGAIVGGLLAWGTLRKIERQTKAIQDSVEVARKSAEVASHTLSVSRRAHLLVEGWDHYFTGSELDEVDLRFSIFNPTDNVARIECCSVVVTEEWDIEEVSGITIGPRGRHEVEVPADVMNWSASLQERDDRQEVGIKGTIVFSSDVWAGCSLDFGVTCIRRGTKGQIVEFVAAYNREQSQEYQS
jgi:hypothetical protein